MDWRRPVGVMSTSSGRVKTRVTVVSFLRLRGVNGRAGFAGKERACSRPRRSRGMSRGMRYESAAAADGVPPLSLDHVPRPALAPSSLCAVARHQDHLVPLSAGLIQLSARSLHVALTAALGVSMDIE